MGDEPKRVTQADLARALNVSRAAVSKAVKTGRIVADDDGLFDQERAVAAWTANTRPSAAKKSAGQTKYAAARARREEHLANIAAMREARMRGELCLVADVKFAGAEVGTILRAKLEMLSDQMAVAIFGLNESEAAAVIQMKIDEVLTEISNQMERCCAELATPPDGA